MKKKEKVQQELASKLKEEALSKCENIMNRADDKICKDGYDEISSQPYINLINLLKTISFWIYDLFDEPAFKDYAWLLINTDLIPDPVDIIRECVLYMKKNPEKVKDLESTFAMLGIVEAWDKQISDRWSKKEAIFSSSYIIIQLSLYLRYLNKVQELKHITEFCDEAMMSVNKGDTRAEMKNAIAYVDRESFIKLVELERFQKRAEIQVAYIARWIDEAFEHRVLFSKEAEVIKSRYTNLVQHKDGQYKFASWRTVGRRNGIRESEARLIHDKAIEKLLAAVKTGKIKNIY